MRSKTGILFISALFLFSAITHGQELITVEGKARITEMEYVNQLDSVVIRMQDGTLAVTSAFKDYIQNLEDRIYFLETCGSYTIKDYDDNTYNVVAIGNQCWMKENLKTTHYNNGTSIPLREGIAPWSGMGTPAYVWYDNDPGTYKDIYGALYNYYAVADTNSSNVCPYGWHVPSDSEWSDLTNYLEVNGFGFGGSGPDIAKSLASDGGWTADATAGNVGNDQGTNNSSEFSGLPGGERKNDGTFNLVGDRSSWWSSTESTSSKSILRYMDYNNDQLTSFTRFKKFGLSVRCIKD